MFDLVITTNHHNSEVSLPFRFYEGSTTITGTIEGNSVTGIGFAELLHFYHHPNFQITTPDREHVGRDGSVHLELTGSR